MTQIAGLCIFDRLSSAVLPCHLTGEHQLVWDNIRKLRGDMRIHQVPGQLFTSCLRRMPRLIYPNDIASPQGYCLGDNRTRGPSQGAYEEAALTVFTMLDELEERLARSRYLFGDRPVETDWRLFTTLVRFDAVYVGHFKCNLRRLVHYPNLARYARDLFQLHNIAAAVTSKHSQPLHQS